MRHFYNASRSERIEKQQLSAQAADAQRRS